MPAQSPSPSAAMSIGRRRLLQAAAALSILLLVTLQFLQFAEERRLRHRVEQSYLTNLQLGRLLDISQDIETGQRGYVLTGNPVFLEPFVKARATSSEALAVVRRDFSDRPDTASELRQLESLMGEKLDFSLRVIALRQRGETSAATALISAGDGRRTMEQLRSSVDRLRTIEQRELERLRDAAGVSRTRLQLFSIGIQILLLGLLVSAFVAYLRGYRRLQSASQDARDQSTRQIAIFEAASDAMLVLERDGRVESANAAAERLFRSRRDELIGRPAADLFAKRPSDAAVKALLTQLSRGAGSDREQVQIFTGVRGDGAIFEAEVAISAVHLNDGLHFVVALRDATERRRLDRMKSEFVSTVSHELRTPLTSISGSLGLIAGGAAGDVPPRAAKLIEIAHNNSRRLVRLINDILDIEKIESGKMQFDTRLLDLRAVVADAVQGNLGMAAAAGVELALERGGHRAQVKADPDRLIQVFTNLLSNAIKFSPAHAAVRVRIASMDGSHRVTISDCGPGIAPDFQGRLFEKFAQADSSDSRSRGGTGLGLAITKEIVERSGGSISYRTSPKGTDFFVDLPAFEPKENGCVLLLHVDGRMSKALGKLLNDRGISTVAVRDGSELENAAARRSYSAVLLGLNMQGEHASEMVRLIREQPNLSAVPILAAAPGGDGSEVSQALVLVDWLGKLPSSDDLERGATILGKDGRTGPIRVLHVEDDEDVLRVVASAFEGKARLSWARDLEEARQALAASIPDLVILDLALPEENGLALLPMLRDLDGKPIPVVVYTAHDEDPDISSRVAAMLTKSKVDLDELVSTVLAVVTGPVVVQ